MKTFCYLTSAHFRSPSKAAIDANVPLNSTLETLTLKVFTTERGSLATYLRLLLSVHHVTINSASSSMDEVKSIVDMLLDSFNDVRLNTGSPQSHYSSVVDVFGKKALLEIYDGLSDKTKYLVDIEHENGARREWTETINENHLIKISIKVGSNFL
ncbi:hypothetical protein RMATCC62417_05727 [Rhizopus microsporus]|nr:hypothetical protein RMATCC62417_05727 [Rhizopus microsporus]